MSRKQSRISEQIKEIVANFVVENIPTQYGIVSITRVLMTKDGSIAKVYFIVLPEENSEKVKAFLEENKSELRSRIRKLKIKVIPELDFEEDKELRVMEKIWGRNE